MLAVRAEGRRPDGARMADAGHAVCSALPRSQRRIKLSSPPEASVLPSGLKATARTMSAEPWKVRKFCWLATSQSRTVLSLLPEASVLPSLLKAMQLTGPLWPSSLKRSVAV